tara:strand:+ start:1262 stop:1726 length:465 start_codon:yes stop_codon:yes gene_type:complete
MATSTLLQYLDQSSSDGDYGITASNRRQIETYIAGGSISANDLVAFNFDTAGGETDGEIALTVVQADSGSANSIAVVGFALNDASDGEKVDITVAGIHVSANVNGSVAKGDRLSISATAGQADTYVNSDTVPIIGYALEDDATNVASVMVIKQF